MNRLLLLAPTLLIAFACQQGAASNPPMAPTNPSPPAPSGRSPVLDDATRLAPGESITARVEMDAVHCFPNWDSLGRCRTFRLTASADGLLEVTLTWTPLKGEWDPDLFLVNHDNVWTWAGDGGSPRTAALAVRSGLTYHIVVMSYLPAPQEFALSTEVR